MHPAPADTLAGMPHRGRGLGAMLASTDPDSAGLVRDCIAHHYRWDWQVEDRTVYLARLVRDLTGDPWHRRAREAVTAVQDYVRDGPHRLDVLEVAAAAAEWPHAWWDDLADTTRHRLTPDDRGSLLWRSDPWLTWAQEHAWAARPATARFPGRPDPHRDRPTREPLALLLDRDLPPAPKTRALFEIARHGPEPATLECPTGEGWCGYDVAANGLARLPVRRQSATPRHAGQH